MARSVPMAVAVLLMVTVSCVSDGASLAQTVASKVRPPIHIELRPEKTHFKAGEDFRADVILRNVDNSPWYVDSRMYWGGQLFVAVLDNRLERVQLPAHYHLPVPPSDPADTAVLVRLRTGAFFGMSIETKAEDLLPRTGKYFLRATYMSELWGDFVAPSLRGLQVYWHDMPSIQSELIPVERVK